MHIILFYSSHIQSIDIIINWRREKPLNYLGWLKTLCAQQSIEGQVLATNTWPRPLVYRQMNGRPASLQWCVVSTLNPPSQNWLTYCYLDIWEYYLDSNNDSLYITLDKCIMFLYCPIHIVFGRLSS